MEFSNGHHFYAKNPIWHISRTYEKCGSGINYAHRKLQNILVSAIFELVECFFYGASKTTGISKINCTNCKTKCSRNSFVFDVNKMPHIAERQFLLEEGVKTSIQTNITNMQGETIGIIGCDFCDIFSQLAYNEKNEEELIAACQILTGYAKLISYKLANFKKR